MNWITTSTGNIPEWTTTSYYDDHIIKYIIKK